MLFLEDLFRVLVIFNVIAPPMSKEKDVFSKKHAEISKTLELEVIVTFMSIFIIPTALTLFLYFCCGRNDIFSYSIVLLAMVLVFLYLFFYSKKLDKEEGINEKYD